MIGNVCAVKRDINRILETPQLVESSNFQIYVASSQNPALNTQVYALKQEGDNYYLYNLITKLDFYIKLPSDMEFWYEGMVVTIFSSSSGMKAGTGRLVHQGSYMDKGATKEEIVASNCKIKAEYQELFNTASNNQLIPEEYLEKPEEELQSVKFYFDSRYLTVARSNYSTNDFNIIEGDYTGLSKKTLEQVLNPTQEKIYALSYVVCKPGDILSIAGKESSEYAYITIGGIWKYESDSNVKLIESNATSVLEFEITQDCFATCSIHSPRYKITASLPGNYEAPAEGNAILEDGYDFGFTLSANSKATPTYAKSGSTIALSMSLNYPQTTREELHYIMPIVTVSYLEDGVSKAVNCNPNQFTENANISNCSFTMPAADCHITVELKLTGEGEDQYIEPTGSESGYALAVIGNIESVTVEGSYHTMPALVITQDKVNVSFTRKLGYSYTYSLYYTSTGTALKAGVILSDYIEVDVFNNLTLDIQELETDCVYTSATGKLSLDENWDNDNPIIGHGYYNNRSYTVDTENPLQTSGINNNFRNKSITGVTFNSTNDVFHIYNNAFKDCDILINTSINGPKSISVGSSSFENTTSLQFADWMDNITSLSEKSFKNSGILEYTSNPDITNIPKQAFQNCARLESVSLHNSNLTSIEECAFENCNNLSSVSIPKCIQEINKYAFRYSGIPSITTSSSAQLLGGCTFITDSISPEISVIKEGVFQGCDNLKDIYLPDSIEHIKTLSFAGCDNIQNFSSPGLKTIAQGAFKDTWIEDRYNYNNLIGDGYLAHLSDTSGVYFEFPHRLTNPNLHVTLIKPDPNVDKYILYKRPVIFPGGGFNYYSHSNIVSISDYGFSNNDIIIDWIKPYNIDFQAYSPQTQIEHIGNYAFKNCGVKFIDLNWKNVNFLGEGAFYNCRALSNVFAFEDAPITKIPDYCFYNCGGDIYGLGYDSDLPTEYTFKLPNTTKEIGDYAFYNCRQLMGIKNHALCPIKTIGKYAFAKCFRNTHNIWDAITWTTVFAIKTALTIYCSWYVASSNSWGAFDVGSVLKVWFTDIAASESALTAGWLTSDILHAVGAGAGIADVVTGASIGWDDNSNAYPSSLAFAIQSCIAAAKTRSNLIFPHLQELGEGAFSKCTYLGRVIVGDTVTQIPDYAFYGCTRLIGVDFCKNVDWNDDSGVSQFYVDSNIETIGKFSFSKCKHLHDVSIDAMLKSATCIKEGAFKDSVVNYTSYQNETDGFVESALTIPDTLTTLEAGSLGFNRKNKFIFISDNPRTKQYSSETFAGGTDSKIFLIVPEGTKNDYMLIFPNVPSDNICELSKSDVLWKQHKLAGYTIPWLAD